MSKDPRIDHVIVLMLENRSFDHMLGYLYPDKTQAEFRGLQNLGTKFSNPRSLQNNEGTVEASPGTPWITWPDPPHEFRDVTLQLYGTAPDKYLPNKPLPTMDGFVAAYRAREEDLIKQREQAAAAGAPPEFEPIEATGEGVMRCFDTDTLPALHTLAREFAVCDGWFSSLPGPTWPNRFFVHCATCDGRVAMNLPDLVHPYQMDTIFNRLEEAGRTWNIYYHDIPQSRTLRKIRDRHDNFKLVYDFNSDVQNGALANYTFIEPRYFDFLSQKANDQHPPHDVRYGDVLIGRIYEALRANDEVWKKSALIIVWDEHGGFCDHMPPTKTMPPGVEASEAFKFDWYGVRVPAVLISPFVERGVVSHTTFDHSSIAASLKEIFDLPTGLTARDKGAKTFTDILALAEPREVELRQIPRTAHTAAIWDLVEHAEQKANDFRELNRATQNQKLSNFPLSDLQNALLTNANELLKAPRQFTVEGEGALHVHQAMQWVRYPPPNAGDG